MGNKITNLINSFFGKSESKKNESPPSDKDLVFPTNKNLPIEEKFIQKFTEYGGRFLFCENREEVQNNIREIVSYEKTSDFLCFDEELKRLLEAVPINSQTFSRDKLSDICFIKCEYLVAFDGSIMVSSCQTGKRKLMELPKKYIVLANPRQIASNISEALEHLKSKHKEEVPTNISCIRKDIHGINTLNEPEEVYLLLVDE